MAGGAPRKVNEIELEKLASFGCTVKECASFFGVTDSAIRKSYSRLYHKGKESGKIRLRKIQWNIAIKGNAAMAIFLGKNYLEQTDKQEIAGKDGQPIKIAVEYVKAVQKEA